ncbi:MAG TPA: TIGR02466 family protein [Streptosporangiaceae bacterium]|nr:TIGR02466 family protein [Streptosporangiaceae bacterium]
MTATATRQADASRTLLRAWKTPIYQATFAEAEPYNARLRELILEADRADAEAANGIEATKSSKRILQWDDPAVTWLTARIHEAATALTTAVLGAAAPEACQGFIAEAWAVVYGGGGSLRPHIHHDSPWSGVYYVDTEAVDETGEAGYLQLIDPRPAAVARQASPGAVRVKPIPGRMVAFPGWVYHSVKATHPDQGLRISVAFNVGFDSARTAMP